MPISGTTTDYTGRLVDIYISGKLNPLSIGAQPVTYGFGQHTKYIAGVQKLAQRYLISLMNSGLVQDLQGRVSSNVQTAVHLFNLASLGVTQSFKAYQNANPGQPLDEQLAAVQLVGAASGTADSINFTANLITAAGTTVQFVLPMPLQ